jgi:hypothetical protein
LETCARPKNDLLKCSLRPLRAFLRAFVSGLEWGGQIKDEWGLNGEFGACAPKICADNYDYLTE